MGCVLPRDKLEGIKHERLREILNDEEELDYIRFKAKEFFLEKSEKHYLASERINEAIKDLSDRLGLPEPIDPLIEYVLSEYSFRKERIPFKDFAAIYHEILKIQDSKLFRCEPMEPKLENIHMAQPVLSS